MNSKISIIVPVSNSEKYIGRCLDSILWQTYAELEVIIVDDGSCDRSGEICDEYAHKDDMVKVWHTENAGVSVARNYVLKKVTGDYVMFVDSDDWIDSTMCEEMILVALQKDSDILITNAKNWQVINNIVNSCFDIHKLDFLSYCQAIIKFLDSQNKRYDTEAHTFYLRVLVMVVLQLYQEAE